MSEKELDSSSNDYIEENISIDYLKQQEWEMAIGFQKVDDLKPSMYLDELSQENIDGKKTIYEVEEEQKENVENYDW